MDHHVGNRGYLVVDAIDEYLEEGVRKYRAENQEAYEQERRIPES
jgi:hypothetical protein